MTKSSVEDESFSGRIFQCERTFHGELKDPHHSFFCKERANAHRVDGADLKASKISVDGHLFASRYSILRPTWGGIKFVESSTNLASLAPSIVSNLKGARIWTKGKRVRVYHQGCFIDLSGSKEFYGANDSAADPQKTIFEIERAYQKAYDNSTVGHLVFCTKDHPNGAPAHRLPLFLKICECEVTKGPPRDFYIEQSNGFRFNLIESRDIISGDTGREKLLLPITADQQKAINGKNLLWVCDDVENHEEILFAGIPMICMILKEIYQWDIGTEVSIEYLSRKVKRCCGIERLSYIFRFTIRACAEIGIIALRKDPKTKMYTNLTVVAPFLLPLRGRNVDIYSFLRQYHAQSFHLESA